MAKNQVNAIDLLTSQHREVEQLFEEYESAEGPEEKQAIFEDVADKLAVHASIEEKFFYPAVRARKTEDMVLEAYVEHTSVKRLLADLMDSDPAEAVFDAKMKVLREQVSHHVEEEEDELFPAAKKVLDDEELQAVAQEMSALQADLEDEGEPRYDIPSELGSSV